MVILFLIFCKIEVWGELFHLYLHFPLVHWGNERKIPYQVLSREKKKLKIILAVKQTHIFKQHLLSTQGSLPVPSFSFTPKFSAPWGTGVGIGLQSVPLSPSGILLPPPCPRLGPFLGCSLSGTAAPLGALHGSSSWACLVHSVHSRVVLGCPKGW